MSELNILITEKMVNFRKEALAIFKKEHSIAYPAIDKFLKSWPTKVGMQVTQNGAVVGTYTFILDGIQISEVITGSLEPQFNIPFWGNNKLYGIMERKDIEAMLEDHSLLTKDLFKNAMKYLPMVTIKFLK